MENKDKYYTPTLNELKEGFRYLQEIYDEDKDEYTGKYSVEIFDAYGLGHDDYHTFTEGRVLAKYLDQKDLEDLGFKIEQWGATKGDITIECNIYNTQEDTIDIYCVNDLRFKGTIKNKFELIHVLKMLNIQ